MKECRSCHKDKSLDEFYRASVNKDGRRNVCKKCDNKTRVKWSKKNPERQAGIVKSWKINNKERNREQNQKAKARHRKRHSGKERARRIVERAVRRGDLSKPANCSRCPRSALPPADLHAHHSDYAKPLQVEWLCRKCHETETFQTSDA